MTWALGACLLTLAGPLAAERATIVALALDTSGSIRRSELAQTRELALGVLASLPPGSEIAVFSFDDQARLLLPRTSGPRDVQRAVDGLTISGRYTVLYYALYDASRYLRDSPGARRAIVLVTDGKDENSALKLEDGLKLAQDLGIPVFCVGVGEAEERVLRRIAKLTGGDYLPSSEATGSAIAARILAAPLPTTAFPPPAGPPSPPGSAGVPGGGREAKAGAASPGPLAVRRAPVSGLVGTGIALAVLAAAFAYVALRRRRTRPRCPSCGTELPNPFATCARCAPSAPSLLDTAQAAGLSGTVLTRMNITEEYLDKTVTLRETAVLTITKGPGAGRIIPLSELSSTSLGRARANDVVLEDVAVSSQHCRIRPEQGRFVLNDLNSTNGTLVNDRRVSRHVLAEGDVIRIGETSLEFRLERQRS